jgi:hypothetical protein
VPTSSHDTQSANSQQNCVQIHQDAADVINSHHNATITKFRVGKLFSRAWNKGTRAGNVVKGSECTDMFPFRRSAIADVKFLSSPYFHQVSTDCVTEHLKSDPVFNSRKTYADSNNTSSVLQVAFTCICSITTKYHPRQVFRNGVL